MIPSGSEIRTKAFGKFSQIVAEVSAEAEHGPKLTQRVVRAFIRYAAKLAAENGMPPVVVLGEVAEAINAEYGKAAETPVAQA